LPLPSPDSLRLKDMSFPCADCLQRELSHFKVNLLLNHDREKISHLCAHQAQGPLSPGVLPRVTCEVPGNPSGLPASALKKTSDISLSHAPKDHLHLPGFLLSDSF
jgi:hypothetical protein